VAVCSLLFIFYNKSIFIFFLERRYCNAKYESETFIKKKLRNVVVIVVAATEWGKCPFGIFDARVKCGASNTWSYHTWSVSVASAAVVHILYILHSAEIIN